MSDEVKFDLSGKVAIVTGASRGIGEGIARAYVKAGARVAISSRKQEALDRVAEMLSADGGEVLPVAAHSGKLEALENLVSTVTSHFGEIDILVNNAATNPVFGPMVQCPEMAFDKIFQVNLKGPFFLSNLVAESMIARNSGTVINIASIAGLKPALGLGVYGMTKAALIGMTRQMAAEWGPAGVRVNAIAPGVIRTRFSQLLVDTPEIVEEVLRDCPLGRVGEVNDVIGAAVFLASDASSYVHGHVLTVDGGTTFY